MPRLHLLLFVSFLAVLTLSAKTAEAFPMPTYDLDSLCYKSTDVVEASLVRHHTPGQEEWNDTFTVTVSQTLEGTYKAGDQINSLHLEYFHPAETGQRCILFIARATPSTTSASLVTASPWVVDMLLIVGKTSIWAIDTFSLDPDHVQRYFQAGNPGPQRAGGVAGPSLAEEHSDIIREWAEVDRFRSLLSGVPRSEDIPALQALLRQRESKDRSNPGSLRLVDAIAQAASLRLSALQSDMVR